MFCWQMFALLINTNQTTKCEVTPDSWMLIGLQLTWSSKGSTPAPWIFTGNDPSSSFLLPVAFFPLAEHETSAEWSGSNKSSKMCFKPKQELHKRVRKSVQKSQKKWRKSGFPSQNPSTIVPWYYHVVLGMLPWHYNVLGICMKNKIKHMNFCHSATKKNYFKAFFSVKTFNILKTRYNYIGNRKEI